MYDIEDFLDDVRNIITTKFNPKLEAIAAEKTAKGKTVVTPPIDMDNALYEQTWNDGILNHPFAILYGFADGRATPLGPATAQTIKVFAHVITTDSGQDRDGIKRLHRYSRAMREIFEENRHKYKVQCNVKIDAIMPVSFLKEEDSSDEIRVGGVWLTADLV